jgi:hypothetical protein
MGWTGEDTHDEQGTAQAWHARTMTVSVRLPESMPVSYGKCVKAVTRNRATPTLENLQCLVVAPGPSPLCLVLLVTALRVHWVIRGRRRGRREVTWAITHMVVWCGWNRLWGYTGVPMTCGRNKQRLAVVLAHTHC